MKIIKCMDLQGKGDTFRFFSIDEKGKLFSVLARGNGEKYKDGDKVDDTLIISSKTPNDAQLARWKNKQKVDLSLLGSAADNTISEKIDKYADVGTDREFSTEEQDEIESILSGLNSDKLQERIHKQQGKSRKITERSHTVAVRDNLLMECYKKLRGYTCQFCSTRIKKANGRHYIEACHIKSVEEGGSDNEDNILILCPNCHKLFDYGKREVIEHTQSRFVVKLNEHKFEASFKK